jgi:drug/metabolite transporter (DMT)-like permease
MPHPMRAYLNLSLAMVIVGSAVVFGKVIVSAFPVFLASGLRFALASAVMLPLVRRREGRLPALPRRDWLTLTIMAFAGQFIFTVLLLYGLTLTSAMEAGLIASTSPAAMALIAFLALGERMAARRVLGVLLAVAGVIAVNGVLAGPSGGPEGDRWLGNLLVCGSVLGEAVFLLFRKRITTPVSDLVLTTYLCLLGLGMFLPVAVYHALYFDFSAPGLLDWGSIAYFGLVYTAVAYLLWFRGVARVSGGTAGVFTAVMPVAAVALSHIFLDEPFTDSNLLGAGLILAAILIMTWSREARQSI